MPGIFTRERPVQASDEAYQLEGARPTNIDPVTPPHTSTEKEHVSVQDNNAQRKHGWIKEDGDAGRGGFHPW